MYNYILTTHGIINKHLAEDGEGGVRTITEKKSNQIVENFTSFICVQDVTKIRHEISNQIVKFSDNLYFNLAIGRYLIT